MQPLKITFTFQMPVLIDSEYPIHLDALLAYAVAKEAEDCGLPNAWELADDLSAFLERTEGQEWVWKASRLVFTPASGVMFQNMIRRSDPLRYYEDLGELWVNGKVTEDKPLGRINPETFKIDTRSGQHRGYQWLAACKWMYKAEAWVIGDKEAIESLVTARIKHIGKDRNNGYGRIKSIAVEESDEIDMWMLRVLPAGMTGLPSIQYEPVNACLRAPYWNKLNRVVAQEPLI